MARFDGGEDVERPWIESGHGGRRSIPAHGRQRDGSRQLEGPPQGVDLVLRNAAAAHVPGPDVEDALGQPPQDDAAAEHEAVAVRIRGSEDLAGGHLTDKPPAPDEQLGRQQRSKSGSSSKLPVGIRMRAPAS